MSQVYMFFGMIVLNGSCLFVFEYFQLLFRDAHIKMSAEEDGEQQAEML